jgi:hypothetical protein
LIITKKNYSELKKKGFSRIKLNQSISSELLESIKFKTSRLYKNHINEINKISNKKFINSFGNVSQRFFDFKTAYKFNEILKFQFKNNLNLNATLHNPIKSNIKFNKNLSKKDLSFYWRIVRSDKSDVGRPHNDEQFWNLLNKKELNFKFKIKDKFKIWIPLYGVTKQNSLRVLDKKYFDEGQLFVTKINGVKKPNIDERWIKKNKKNFTACLNGENAILFDYKTIHFAPKNKSKKIRISCEATIVIK